MFFVKISRNGARSEENGIIHNGIVSVIGSSFLNNGRGPPDGSFYHFSHHAITDARFLQFD